MFYKVTKLRYFLEFSYKGTHYHGWQYQPNALSVQEVLEEKLSILLGQPMRVTAAGRTDTGVHAKQMFAHFEHNVIDTKQLHFRLNSFLPKDIAILSILEVTPEAHARFDATARLYEYYINTKKDPFSTFFSWQITHKTLDLDLMNKACEILFKHSDFTSFSRLHSDNKTNICRIDKAFFTQQGNKIKFTIQADRFLRNMVRAIVGTLVDVGLSKLNLTELEQIIVKKDRKFASASAPAQGLFLSQISYPKEIFKP